MDVAILGCGPAGLMAAQAVARQGWTPRIFSRKVKSQTFGAMFLHKRIPGIYAGRNLKILVVKHGTKEGYAQLVYGDIAAPVSWDNFEEGRIKAWSLQTTYDRLWDKFEDQIEDMDIDHERLATLEAWYDIVISSIPLPTICLEPVHHQFYSQRIWVVVQPPPEEYETTGNMMWYNGETLGYDWYRYSQIAGWKAWEFSGDPPEDHELLFEAEGKQVVVGKKPLGNSCSCWPSIFRIGRFGTWTKNVLSHHAFYEARAIVEREKLGIESAL